MPQILSLILVKIITIMIRSFVLLAVSVAAILVDGQPNSQEGFMNIDCGTPEDYSHTDSTTNLVYTSDAKYISTGTIHNISAEYKSNAMELQHHTLRSFPDGARNCYTLKPVDRGSKYMVRAFFMYGNYDGRESAQNDNPLQFDLYLGVNIWSTMKIYDASLIYRMVVMTVTTMDFLSVCLVNKGSGIPFISSLELRAVKSFMYPFVTPSRSLVEFNRLNLGASSDQIVRYPDDPFDRMWGPWNSPSWTPVSTPSPVQHLADPDDPFLVPSAVMRTAATPADNTSKIKFFWPNAGGASSLDGCMVAMHFAELTPGATRSFTITLNDDTWHGTPFSPSYLLAGSIYSGAPDAFMQYNFTISAANDSALPPILNAIEIFFVLRRTNLDTDSADVEAINSIKDHFQVKRDWMGDPCVPNAFAWEGLSCSYGLSTPPRITTLNLSFSGLAGEIPAFLANLKALKYLDLSNNNLTGKVPESLAHLLSLKLLNLMGNQLTEVPNVLRERAANGSLTLSVNIVDNLDDCDKGSSCDKKKKISTPIIAVISIVSTVLLLLLLLSLWKLRRRRNKGSALSTFVKPHYEDYSPQPTDYNKSTIQFESRQYTSIELENITNNFERVIGNGGFGNVYHGYLQNGAQVAVKLRSLSSMQGNKEFLAEVQLLARVHHRNLVSLVGYCKDGNYMALIYEYMAQGSLSEHLKGKGGDAKTLSWRERLQIALEAAQGIEYLHKGCKPPIIHRDVKTSNILLSEKLEAKLADLGLSKALHEAATHVSTNVVGTPGYLDPEYYNTYQLNEKSDVYSFGIVLLELITGHPAILTGPEKCHIVQWVRSRLARAAIAETVDARLQGEYETNSVWKVADVAMRCTTPASHQRPNMADVVMQLKEAVQVGVAYERSQDLCIEDIYSSRNLFIDVARGQMNPAVSGPSAR